jgi:hypothetical protein
MLEKIKEFLLRVYLCVTIFLCFFMLIYRHVEQHSCLSKIGFYIIIIMKAVGREVKRSILFLSGLRELAKGWLDGFLIYFIKYNLIER